MRDRILTFGLAISIALLGGVTVAAQEQHRDCPLASGKTARAEPSPYAGFEVRAIKALSDQDRERLLSGHGMGLALAAELNSYPGPKHVLELADGLQLTDEQIRVTQAIFHEMRERAVDLGRRIIDAEAALDRQFAEATIDDASLAAAVQEIGRLQADLRLAHLKAHLEMRAALSPEQNRRYDELRGYRTASSRAPR